MHATKFTRVFYMTILVFILSACASGGLFGPAPTPTPAATLTPIPTITRTPAPAATATPVPPPDTTFDGRWAGSCASLVSGGSMTNCTVNLTIESHTITKASFRLYSPSCLQFDYTIEGTLAIPENNADLEYTTEDGFSVLFTFHAPEGYRKEIRGKIWGEIPSCNWNSPDEWSALSVD